MHQTILLIILFSCHFLADYTHLSTNWMLSAKRFGTPLFPILCHALVHTLLMGLAIMLFNHIYRVEFRTFLFCLLFQLISHFAIDVWKGRMNGLFPTLQSPANKWHWVMFGFDQLLHAVVIIFMVNTIIN